MESFCGRQGVLQPLEAWPPGVPALFAPARPLRLNPTSVHQLPGGTAIEPVVIGSGAPGWQWSLTLGRQLVMTLTPRLARPQRHTLESCHFTFFCASASICSHQGTAQYALCSFVSVTSVFGRAKLCSRPPAMKLSLQPPPR